MEYGTAIEEKRQHNKVSPDYLAAILGCPPRNGIETVFRDQARNNKDKKNHPIDFKAVALLRAADRIQTLEELKRRIVQAIGTISNKLAANGKPYDVLAALEKRYVALSQGIDRVLAATGRIQANMQAGHDEDHHHLEQMLHDDLHHHGDHAEHYAACEALHGAVSDLHKFVDVNGHELDRLGMQRERETATGIAEGLHKAGWGRDILNGKS